MAATKLGRSLGAKHDVILIDRRDEHIFTPSFLFLMLGQRRPEDLKRKLQILERRKVKVMQAEILQDMWREQRLRNIRGLGLISRRRQMRQQGK